MPKHWIPLESSPDVLNKYMSVLGADDSVSFYDVFGLEDDLLAFVPQPVYAVLLLFPITEKTEAHRTEEASRLTKAGQSISPGLFFLKQTVDNACGTIGLIHAVLNNRDKFFQDGFFANFYQKCVNKSPEERARILEEDDEIERAHAIASLEGQTRAPSAEEKVNLHFIALVETEGWLYELDGRKEAPINHGQTTRETFLKDAVKVIREFMERAESVEFSVLALSKKQQE